MGFERPAIKVRECPHAKDDPLHLEVIKWVEGWAQRIHDECPIPMTEGEWGAHETQECHALDERWAEIVASAPDRFRECTLANQFSIQQALFFGIHPRLRGWAVEPEVVALANEFSRREREEFEREQSSR